MIEIPPDLQPDNPLRAVDWRSGLIAFLRQHDPDRRHPWKDPWRKRAWQLDQLPDRRPPSGGMVQEYPYVLDTILRLKPSIPKWPFTGHSGLNPTRGRDLKNLLESYTLTGLSTEEIAKRIPIITVPFVETYQAMQFDVMDRLQDREFVLKHVIQLDPTAGITNDEPYVMWLECGCLAGPECLDAMTSICKVDSYSATTELTDYLSDRQGASPLLRDIVRERMLPDYDRTVEDLEQLYRQLVPQPEVIQAEPEIRLAVVA